MVTCKKPILLVGLVSFILFSFTWLKSPFPPDDLIPNIAAHLQRFYTEYPQEKIYLHQDKTVYSQGETIWFKAYVTLSPDHQLDTLSRVMYAELIDPNQKVLYSRKLNVVEGTAFGDIHLPDSLNEGTYQLRAYTNWMRNFSDDYFFSREIKLVNSDLAAMQARIAFRATPHAQGDSLLAAVEVNTSYAEPLQHQDLHFRLVVNGKTVDRFVQPTDAAGKVSLKLNLPKVETGSPVDAFLTVESVSKEHPYQKTFRLPVGKSSLDLTFFPEGGHWVNGLDSRLAFKAIDISGKGIEVKGRIIDHAGNEVASFQSQHLGMGLVNLKPQAGKTYRAQVRQVDGSLSEFPLPLALEQGIGLQVDRVNPETVRLTLRHSLGNNLQDSLFLVAHAEGKVFFAAKSSLNQPEMITHVPANRFPAGLVCITLFNRAGQPLAERLALVNQPPQLNIALSTDKAEYGKREKVKLRVVVKDADGQPVKGDFSLAVRDVQNAPLDESFADNIYAYSVLGSELKGHIEQPAYYFDSNQPLSAKHLDLLLMTQGWRRFDWNKIMKDDYPAYQYPFEQSLLITGKVRRELNKTKAAGNTQLTVLLQSATLDTLKKKVPHQLYFPTTAEDGSFLLNGLDFQDTMNVFIQARNAKGKIGMGFLVSHDVFQAPTTSFFPVEALSATLPVSEGYLRKMNNWQKVDKSLRMGTNAILLPEFVKKASRTDPRRRYTTTTAVIRLSKFKYPLPDLFWYIKHAGVALTSLSMTKKIDGSRSPMYLLDGWEVTAEQIGGMLVDEIETIEVLNDVQGGMYRGLRRVNYPGQTYGDANNGVINFLTKRNNPNYDYSQDKAASATNFKLVGYSKAREFYSPRYDVAEDRHNLPDFRSTVYWQSRVRTNEQGIAEVSFFTSDETAQLVATCEGISRKGRVGMGTYAFDAGQKKQ